MSTSKAELVKQAKRLGIMKPEDIPYAELQGFIKHKRSESNASVDYVNDGFNVGFFKDAAGEWRWHLASRNGKIVADSAEGYKRRGGAKRAFKKFMGL